MRLNMWGRRLALGIIFVALTLACRTSDVLVAQNNTPAATRARPTFTPQPPTPTPTPPPTATRTRAPTARPTARPPTAVPQPVAPPPTSPPAFPWTYHAQYNRCEHSGNAYIKGAIYQDKNDPNSKTPEIKVRASFGPDETAIVDVVSEDFYTVILSSVGGGARPGTYYVWVIDGSGKRISEISPPIRMNNLGPDAPGVCWAALVDFWREPGR